MHVPVGNEYLIGVFSSCRAGRLASGQSMEPISVLVYKIFRGTPQHSEWMVSCLQGAWPGIVGEKLAQVCQPAAFEDSRLVIEILDRDWDQAIRSTEKELLVKIRQTTGDEVRRLSFASCGTHPQPTPGGPRGVLPQ
jgi:hypothetical protein